MGVVRNLFDGLTNALTGAGTTTDARAYNQYFIHRLTPQQIDAAFRASWLMRKGITKPALDMTREWRDWQADNETIELLEAEEKRLGLREKFRRAEILRGLGGAGMVIYIDGDNHELPIDPTRIKQGGITRIHVWHHTRFGLGQPIENWGDDWFGHPSYYQISLATSVGQSIVKFHPSRVIAFRGEDVADMSLASWQEAWWGDSKVQVVKDAVDNVHTGEDGFAALIKDARNRRVYVPGLLNRVATSDGEALMAKRFAAFGAGESLYGVTYLDGGDSDGKGGEKIEDRQMVWAGIPDIKQANLSVAAAAFNMPETVLLGRSPAGMNATGKGDEVQWQHEVKARQDMQMRPCLDQLDAALIPSALGKRDPAIWWQFAPLTTPTEAEEAVTFKDTAAAIVSLQSSGLVPDQALAEGVQNLLNERAWLPGLDVALGKIPEAERFPSEIAEPKPDPTTIDPATGLPATGD